MSRSDDLAGIHAAFAVPISYRAVNQSVATPVQAVLITAPGDPFQGPGATSRRRTYELRYADVPAKPLKGAQITVGATYWSVIDSLARDEIEAWHVNVEKAS